MSNDQLEDEGLMVICKHCNSPLIKEIEDVDNHKKVEHCADCGTVDYTRVVTEEEFEKISKSETVV